MTKHELRKIMGRIIQIERRKRGLNQEELAELVGITASYMGLLERGERGVTCLSLMKFSQVLELPMGSFFRIVEEEDLTEENFLREKLITLTTTSSEKELEFILDMVKHIRKLKLIP